MKPDSSSPWPAGRLAVPEMCGEDARAQVLASYGPDALEGDEELDRIVDFAARLCGAPAAMVSLVEEERQRFLARRGVDASETPRATSFCAHAMFGEAPMEVPDACQDERFADNPLVTGEPHIRFYAGAPLVSLEGAPLGSLCVIDMEPRPGGLTDVQRQGLSVLASAVMRRLHSNRETRDREALKAHQQERLRLIAERLPVIVWAANPDGDIEFGNAALYDFCGTDDPARLHFENFVHPEHAERLMSIRNTQRAKGEKWEAEALMRRHDGDTRWMLLRAWPLRNNDDEIEFWFGAGVDIDDTRRTSEANDILARELSHRIKNIFAVISGLVSLRARKVPEARDFAEELGDTIRALGRAHDFVRPHDGAKSNTLHGLLAALMAPYGNETDGRVIVEGDDAPTGPRAATPMALVFHELATNSAKYGALSNDGGTIRIGIAVNPADETVTVRWHERGGPPPDPDANEGFGSRLVKLSVEGQLDGTIERHWTEDGVDVELCVPLNSIST